MGAAPSPQMAILSAGTHFLKDSHDAGSYATSPQESVRKSGHKLESTALAHPTLTASCCQRRRCSPCFIEPCVAVIGGDVTIASQNPPAPLKSA
jgi:hypothetical protein